MIGRLEATVFGTLVSVCALRMSKVMVKTGINVYGPKKWDKLIDAICFGPNPKNVIADVRHTIGHEIRIEYRGSGMSMNVLGFGFEVFHGGAFCEIDAVSAAISSLQPTDLMRQYNTGDMLGVFWGERGGVMSFRWDDVEYPRQEDITLAYMDIAPGLARKRPVDIVVDVTLSGRKADRRQIEPVGVVEGRQHVLHVKK